jgi:hypothetical protein
MRQDVANTPDLRPLAHEPHGDKRIVSPPLASHSRLTLPTKPTLTWDSDYDYAVNNWIGSQRIFRYSNISDVPTSEVWASDNSFWIKGRLQHAKDQAIYMYNQSGVWGQNDCADRVSLLATGIKGEALQAVSESQARIDELRSLLEGKRILVLGDDRGSLSTVLRLAFGAQAIGVEKDYLKVCVAHCGLMNPDARKDLHVRHGDIWDLVLPESNIRSEIDRYGAFDAIVSWYVFDVGSCAEIPCRAGLFASGRWNRLRADVCETFHIDRRNVPADKFEEARLFFAKWLEHSRVLLKPQGIQVHLQSDYFESGERQPETDHYFHQGVVQSQAFWGKPPWPLPEHNVYRLR